LTVDWVSGPANLGYYELTMLRVFGFKRNFPLGWLCAVSFLLFLVLSGCVISPRRLPGDVVPGTTPTPTPNPSATPTPTPSSTPQGKLYVSNTVANTILRFDQAFTVSGNVAPVVTISGANSQLNGPAYIFLDKTADRLYVANNSDFSILVFDNISTKPGSAAPDRVITGDATTLVNPTDVSVDTTRNLLYVADDTQIEVFGSASTADGPTTPLKTFKPGFAVGAVFIDGVNDRLYAADQTGHAIDIYDIASTLATGAITASRTLGSPTATLTHLGKPAGIQIDGGGRLVVSNDSAKSITIYNNAATVTGDIAPSAEILGSNTGFIRPNQIAIDTRGGNTLYVADPGAGKIAIYDNLSSITGNVAPTRSINGAATTITVTGQAAGVAVDNTR
jgi:hypothetical protein